MCKMHRLELNRTQLKQLSFLPHVPTLTLKQTHIEMIDCTANPIGCVYVLLTTTKLVLGFDISEI